MRWQWRIDFKLPLHQVSTLTWLVQQDENVAATSNRCESSYTCNTLSADCNFLSCNFSIAHLPAVATSIIHQAIRHQSSSPPSSDVRRAALDTSVPKKRHELVSSQHVCSNHHAPQSSSCRCIAWRYWTEIFASDMKGVNRDLLDDVRFLTPRCVSN